MNTPPRAPFPWFGGKSRAASLVWEAFGDVPNYVEPFAGSLAVLLGRPSAPRVETVNDKDAYLSNFWRALQHDPEAVAHFADWPVSEADLRARHRWLVKQSDFRERMLSDPDYFDAKIAGWWIWGICQWIGGGWCRVDDEPTRKVPQLGGGSKGVNSAGGGSSLAKTNRARARQAWRDGSIATPPGPSNWSTPPHGGAFGSPSEQLPCLAGNSGATGRGIHASGLSRKMPKADRGTDSRLQTDAVCAWMVALSERLRRVRVCCGDWSRVLGPTPTTRIGVTGVLLDPPYSAEAKRAKNLYAQDDLSVAHEVREWAIEHGDDPLLRIALCGYEGEHAMPDSWRSVAWKASGGYGARNKDNQNARRERVWFSPSCLGAVQRDLFAGGAE